MTEKRKVFTQTLTVLTSSTSFGQLDFGDCFTLPQSVGFGEIWMGFPVYLKSTEYSATLIEDGVSHSFEDWADVLKVRYGSIERPSSEAAPNE
jgi:hypothetical protein